MSWYIYRDGDGYEYITAEELNDISMLNDRSGLGKSDRPYVIGIHPDEVHSACWMMDGYMHRYYGPAVNVKHIGEIFYYCDSWYLCGELIK